MYQVELASLGFYTGGTWRGGVEWSAALPVFIQTWNWMLHDGYKQINATIGCRCRWPYVYNWPKLGLMQMGGIDYDRAINTSI